MVLQKDFNAIAAILAGDFATATPAEKGKVFAITLSIADYFATQNPRFNRSKFYAAVFGEENHFLVRDRISNEVLQAKRQTEEENLEIFSTGL